MSRITLLGISNHQSVHTEQCSDTMHEEPFPGPEEGDVDDDSNNNDDDKNAAWS